MQAVVRAAVAPALFAAVVATGGPAQGADKQAVLDTYADIAFAMYQDALWSARELKGALNTLVASPSAETMAAARAAWLAARVPYQQTEGYRFGNAYVDDWEGKVNAWPLDEGLIDYVDSTYGTESDENAFYSANVIANPKFTIGGKMIDAASITKGVLQELHEVGGIEANVATGYHAIEFLLWGQDLNGTGPGAGMRAHSDFDTKACTNGNCERRGQYLIATVELLLDDLAEIVAAWGPGGDARSQLMAKGPNGGLLTILTGLGSLSYGELAGERMKLGLLLHDPEEEHDCFADNTHYSHYYNQIGMIAIYNGRYTRSDGSVVSGPSLSDIVRSVDAAGDAEMQLALAATRVRMETMVAKAVGGMAYDQMLGEGNAIGGQVLDDVIQALKGQTKSVERIVASLDIGTIEIEGSDSLDNPDAVFQ